MRRTTFKAKATWLAVAAALTAMLLHAGDRVRFEPASGSFVKVTGTSSVHDWQAEAKEVEGWIEFEPQALANRQVTPAPALRVVVRTANLKSGKSSMDEVMYKALKSDRHPTITYELATANTQPASDVAKGKLVLHTSGRLNVAGTAREISMPVTVQFRGSTIDVTGEVPLKMTDFNVKPPSAMFGAIKSGNDVTVAFRWIVKQR